MKQYHEKQEASCAKPSTHLMAPTTAWVHSYAIIAPQQFCEFSSCLSPTHRMAAVLTSEIRLSIVEPR